MSRTGRVLIAIVAIVSSALLLHQFLSPLSFPGNPTVSTQGLYAASFPDAEGKQQPLAQWRGKVLVINFWASWCSPCREEMPMLDTLQADYGANEVRIVGISVEDVEHLQAFSEQLQVDYPLLAGDFEGMSLARSLGNDKGVLPFTVVIDKSGKIATIMYGLVEKSTLEKTLAPLL